MTKKKTRGRIAKSEAFAPTEEQRQFVEDCAAKQLTDEDIALLIGISEAWLKKHFRINLKKGRARFKLEVGGCLRQKMLEGCTATTIFLGKTVLRLSEPKQQIEHSGSVQAPSIQIVGVTARISQDRNELPVIEHASQEKIEHSKD